MSSRKYEKNRGIELKKKDRKLKEENERLNHEYETLKKEYDLFLNNIDSLGQYKNRSSSWYSCNCKVKINNIAKNIIIDSGCDLSGERMRVLGYVNTSITFQNLIIPITFEISEGEGDIL
ncbi:26859_t:CDS:2, partial [Racocetra persica]